MKNLVYALVGAGFMIACQPSDQPEISGMLTGIESNLNPHFLKGTPHS